jgi:hypothetical protein
MEEKDGTNLRAPTSSLMTGRWWKASGYEIRKNRIVPRPRATITTYDPWADGVEPPPRGAKSSERRPYTTLVDLVDSFAFAPESDGAVAGLDDRSREAICQWCCDHGLLGVLLHLVDSVTFPNERGDLVRFVRAGDRWVLSPIRDRLVRHARRRTAGGVARPVYQGIDAPSASVQRLDEDVCHGEALDETWTRFFAGASVVPAPQSREFWRAYGEPLDEFVEAATFLRDAIEDVSDREGRALPKSKKRDALATINRLTSAVATEIDLGRDGGIAHRWSSPSLIATFAQMVKEDVVSRRIAVCSGCGRTFVTRSPWARFCSDTCKQRVRKRRQRARTTGDISG